MGNTAALQHLSRFMAAPSRRRRTREEAENSCLVNQEGDWLGEHSSVSIICLPEQVLLLIFSFLKLRDLTMASAVCKRWHRLCYDARFWVDLDLSQDINIKRVCNKSLKYILRRKTSIRELNLSGRNCRRVTNDSLRYISRYCPKLRSLNMASRKKIRDTGMKKVVAFCVALEELNLEGCAKISNGTLIYVGTNCKHLKSINLGKCNLIQDFGLEVLVKNCLVLSTISLEACNKVTDQGLRIIAEHCTTLRSINLKRMRKVTNAGIRDFLEKVPILGLSIGLLRSGGVTDNIFYIISRSAPQLELFEFEHFARYEVDGFVLRMAEGCNHLTNLSLYRCFPLSDMTLMRITQICPNLRDIHIFPEIYLH